MIKDDEKKWKREGESEREREPTYLRAMDHTQTK